MEIVTSNKTPNGVFLSYPGGERPGLTMDDLEEGRKFIDDSLPFLTYDPKDSTNKLAIPLGNPFVVPSRQVVDGFSYKGQQFYWDSYFIATKWLMPQGEKNFKLAAGMLDNLTSIFDRFGIIPNSSVYNRLGRSQPPFLTSFIFELYDTYKETHPELDKQWLHEKIDVAKREYATVWMGTEDPHDRLKFRGLSRYYDVDVTHDNIEAESGWDYTPRFGGKAGEYLPADLNALLFKYEMDFARAAGIEGNQPEMDYWLGVAEARNQTMNELMYDPSTGIYRDYNFRARRWGSVASLAGYTPMWAGMVQPRSERARQMIQGLKAFEQVGGLAVTEECEVGPNDKPLQWKFPNRWSSMTMLVAEGAEICGYPEVARSIGLTALGSNIGWFRENGEYLEAYNAFDPTAFPLDGVYPRQRGFGWTNAETEYFSAKYVEGRHLPAAVTRGAVLLDPESGQRQG